MVEVKARRYGTLTMRDVYEVIKQADAICGDIGRDDGRLRTAMRRTP